MLSTPRKNFLGFGATKTAPAPPKGLRTQTCNRWVSWILRTRDPLWGLQVRGPMAFIRPSTSAAVHHDCRSPLRSPMGSAASARAAPRPSSSVAPYASPSVSQLPSPPLEETAADASLLQVIALPQAVGESTVHVALKRGHSHAPPVIADGERRLAAGLGGAGLVRQHCGWLGERRTSECLGEPPSDGLPSDAAFGNQALRSELAEESSARQAFEQTVW